MKIFIPVCAELKDNCGKSWHATGVVETEATLSCGCDPCDSWKQQLFLIPCVRLLPGCPKSDNGVFCVKVDIRLEIYLLRPEACCVKRSDKPEKPCPDLPMYPQMPSPPPDRWDEDCHWRRWEN